MTQKTMRNAGSSEMGGFVEHKYEVLFVQQLLSNAYLKHKIRAEPTYT